MLIILIRSIFIVNNRDHCDTSDNTDMNNPNDSINYSNI